MEIFFTDFVVLFALQLTKSSQKTIFVSFVAE